MKKLIFSIFLFGGILISCSNNSEEFKSAAKELCSCMSKGEVDTDDAASANMNLGLCLLDSKVDLKAPEMVDEINKQCPEYKDGFEDFVKGLK